MTMLTKRKLRSATAALLLYTSASEIAASKTCERVALLVLIFVSTGLATAEDASLDDLNSNVLADDIDLNGAKDDTTHSTKLRDVVFVHGSGNSGSDDWIVDDNDTYDLDTTHLRIFDNKEPKGENHMKDEYTASSESELNDKIIEVFNQKDYAADSMQKSGGLDNMLERYFRMLASQVVNRFQQSSQPYQIQLSPDSRKDIKNIEIVNIQKARKIGVWCHGDDYIESKMDDESLVGCAIDSANSLEIDHGTCNFDDEYDIQAGMIAYVIPSSATDSVIGGSSIVKSVVPISLDDYSTITSDDDPPILQTVEKCVVEMRKRYDEDDRVVQYALIRREHHVLGNVDVHKRDYAYQPVLLKKRSHSLNDIYSSHTHHISHEIEDRIKPQSDAFSPCVSSNSISDHSHPGYNDRQISFRWWSWIDHFTHMFRNKIRETNAEEPTSSETATINQGFALAPGSNSDDRGCGSESAYDRSLYEEAGKQAFAGGSHGEIWRAKRRCPSKRTNCDGRKEYIIKRLKIELGYPVLEAGLREVYFGELLGREAESSALFTTYIDHFFREGLTGQIELWIVFENAGPSLRSYLYTPVMDANGGFVVFQHSSFWRRLRTSIRERSPLNHEEESLAVEIIRPNSRIQQEQDSPQKHDENDRHSIPEGRLLLMNVLKQIITAAAFLHERGIVHRDIKPSNIMCTTVPSSLNGRNPHNIESMNCLLGDFSSAWDEYSSRNLYGDGPTSKETTEDYSPPEILLQRPSSWMPFYFQSPHSYDSWSIGVVALEMLLGTPNVFSVDQRTTVILTNRLRKAGSSSEDIQRALYLAGLSQFCIYVPTMQGKSLWDPLHDAKVVKTTCTLEDFHNALRARDPLGTGFDTSTDLLLHLIWKLLAWDPSKRISASDALLHPYFSSHLSPDFANKSDDKMVINSIVHGEIPGSHNALESQLLDPRIDLNISDIGTKEYICPKCLKKYSDHNSCQKHARLRRHALFCNYDRSKLPHCLNAHTMLPTHSLSGYCDIQGRRRTIEDFHSVYLFSDNQFYGVFDGHRGNLASKFAASSFYRVVGERLSDIDQRILLERNWKNTVKADLELSFEKIHKGILNVVSSSPGGIMDESGTTVTMLFVTNTAVVVANVGDSRAVLSHYYSQGDGITSAQQLTVDHVASSHEEQILIIQRGGSISKSGGIDRVNGQLAVSRSLGDAKLARYLSTLPHVLILTKSEVGERCGAGSDAIRRPCFIILASDGLWDVMTNQEAVEMVQEAISHDNSGYAFQEAAEMLTQEAYVRGSSDNIGVCVVAIV